LLARGLAYWESKRRGRRMPARRDIDPAEMLDLLPNVMLVDVVREPLDFRYRLIGTAIVAHMRHDYTGQRFSALPRQGRDSKLWAAAARILEERRPIFGEISCVGIDRCVRDYRDLYMPLSEDDDAVNMILGLVDFEAG